jgi:enterochelin esterase-like enzyme
VPADEGYGRDVPYHIYLPPCYQQGDEALPTLYLLHGLGGDDYQWLNLGLASTADRLIHDGDIPPFIIVLPWQRTGLQDEIALSQGLRSHVEAHYRALPGPSWRAIGGLSRGGGWAFRLGMKYPGVFSRIGLHSPAVMAGDLTALEYWLESWQGLRTPKLWLDVGDQDSLRPATEQLSERLDELKLDYEFSVRQGDHLAQYWSENLADYLRWYGSSW